jgi:hypothetical protein
MNGKKLGGRILACLYFSFWLTELFPLKAYAYIDPSTTAMLTQIIAGVFISLGFLFGIFRKKIILFFQKIYFGIMKKSLKHDDKK